MKKTALITLVGLIIAGAVGGGYLLGQTSPSRPALAAADRVGFDHGRKFGTERMLETKAEILGMSVEELRETLQNRTFLELAEEQGITLEQWREIMQEKARERWQEMGLSEEEIAERERWQEERHAECGEDCTGCRQYLQQLRQNRPW